MNAPPIRPTRCRRGPVAPTPGPERVRRRRPSDLRPRRAPGGLGREPRGGLADEGRSGWGGRRRGVPEAAQRLREAV